MEKGDDGEDFDVLKLGEVIDGMISCHCEVLLVS